jgi:DNA topoisomerase-2
MTSTAAKPFETYELLSHEEHVLKLPDTYIGSTTTSPIQRWVHDPAANKMVWKTVQMNPGLYKLFDEVIVNARDAFVRASTTEGRLPIKHMDITVAGGIFRVENDGDGIPVELHPTEGCYIPELIFGKLLTSSNYDKDEEKIVGGKNGYGAKLANIFSKRFMVDTQHPASGKRYIQTWRTNMTVCEKPSVRKSTGLKGHVRIECEPDEARFVGAFDSEGAFTDDMVAVFKTRVLELAALVGSGVKVTFNNVAVTTNTFDKYIKLFLKDSATGSQIAYESGGPRWEVGAVLTRQLYSEDEGRPDDLHISFVNGIQTRKGGKHVDYVAKQILGDFCEAAKKKKDKIDIKPGQLKDHVVFFVAATIVNPSFDSQTKECLTTVATKFGSVPKFDGKLVEGLFKLGLLDEARALLEFKAARDAKKTDGKRSVRLRGVPKCDDALFAGTPRSAECTLILTEGDSAAASAVAGLAVVGRERWGVFPLRGKLLNVRDITVQKFNDNEELTSIKRILGLEHGRVYKALTELRYGRVMIMADQDHDGSHIKGLVMNMFHTEWPALLQLGFLCTLQTPLLKVSKGATVHAFYSAQELEAWRATNSMAGWHVKYYKGLGTSTPAEAREWFEKLHEIKYVWDEATNESLSLAFDKKRPDDRKRWLSHYKSDAAMAVTTSVTASTEDTAGVVSAPYSQFVHGELIHFSNADNIRSLPHLMDGLKPSQRKILYSCLKRNLRSEIRVAQLAGYVSEHAAYHHGEASLNSTIVGMAQTYVGSNNISLLQPIGQFGSRLLGGKDSASPRYIHTQLDPIVDALFRKEDQILLKAIDDDGDLVEPEYYLPVVPLIALNGSVGIGTGFSTDIPPYNPADIVSLMRSRLSGKLPTLAGRDLDPWWCGFKGVQRRLDPTTWSTQGTYTLDEDKKTITLDELPVGTWTKDYKVFLDKLLGQEDTNGLKNFDDLYTDIQVKFVLYMTEEGFDDAVAKPDLFVKNFKLATTWKTTNMCCFDTDFAIQRYASIGDILEAFVVQRLPAYERRRLLLLEALQKDLTELEAKRAFLTAILDGRLDLMRKTDDAIVEGLKAVAIPALSRPEAPDTVEAYDYVLRLRMDRVKASAVESLDKEVVALRAQRAELETSTPAALWASDLDEFETAWARHVEVRVAAQALTGAKKVVKKTVVRKVVKKA